MLLYFMKNMKDEWDDLFIERLREISSIGGETVFISATIESYIGNKKMCLVQK